MAYGKWVTPRLEVVDADVDDLGVEDLLELVADQLVHRLHVELGGKALLDAVDDGQLGGALVGLREQPARLVEQGRVLERDGHARGERAEDPLGPLIERRRRQVLQADHADDGVAVQDRDAKPRFGRSLPKVIAPSAVACSPRSRRNGRRSG